ncbi:MAG: aminoglycoside phosphotransferase [Acidobacteria bacterium]|jgi:aminoglycoside/choline kinase family phosphotransferase|nr:aminoglycoside phosphotransferase [Acidobacteriota bacterium]HJN45198.1 phosphotransferase [Vicinamibacterales bacterium]|tara:strand:- start:201 stop:1193 length:993 start_codon:yes stop_codon:yes gene_type:complete
MLVEDRVSAYLRRRSLDPRTTGVDRLHGDASNRCYLRLTPPDRASVILAVHPGPFATDDLPQIAVGALFSRLAIPVPAVIDQAGDLGILALEDLGDQTLQDWMTAPDRDPTALYREAVGLIARLQREGDSLRDEQTLPFTLAFDVSKLSRELEFFRSEFLQAYRRVDLDHKEAIALAEEFSTLAKELAAEPRVLCHRDYHSRNLMVHRGRLVVIDFQDARMGPDTYDLVSLLRDCYVDLSPDLVTGMTEYFLETVPTAHTADFSRRFDLMSVQRHLKALGTFGHQIAVTDRPGFAAYIPRTLGHLRRTLRAYPRFGRLLDLLAPHMPELA